MTIPFARILLGLSLLLGWEAAASGHDHKQRVVHFSCDVAKVSGTLTLPAHDHEEGAEDSTEKSACIVIVGGTLSHTRDGKFIREGAPARDALKRLALQLAEKGYASLRYDKVGYGESKGAEAWQGTYEDEAQVAAAAVKFAREQGEFEKVVVAGESAGAYVACLAAKGGLKADAYVFLGAHCGSGEDIYEYNFARLARLAGEDAWSPF